MARRGSAGHGLARLGVARLGKAWAPMEQKGKFGMKEVSDKVMGEFEKTALEGLNAMREAMRHKGNDRRYFEQGRIGAAAVNGFVRLRASESNRLQVELMTRRIEDLAAAGALTQTRPRALVAKK